MSASGYPTGTFVMAANPSIATSTTVSGKILGEEWSDVSDTAATWVDAVDAAAIWSDQAGSTGVWLGQ